MLPYVTRPCLLPRKRLCGCISAVRGDYGSIIIKRLKLVQSKQAESRNSLNYQTGKREEFLLKRCFILETCLNWGHSWEWSTIWTSLPLKCLTRHSPCMTSWAQKPLVLGNFSREGLSGGEKELFWWCPHLLQSRGGDHCISWGLDAVLYKHKHHNSWGMDACSIHFMKPHSGGTKWA